MRGTPICRLGVRGSALAAVTLAAFTIAVFTVAARVVPGPALAGDADALYAGRRWLELRDALRGGRGTPLQRGAVANAFNVAEAERTLLLVARSSNRDEADQAYGFLSELYLRSGRYRRLTEVVQERVRRFPDSAGARGRSGETAVFSGLPDQRVVRRVAAVVSHERRVFLPASIDGTGVRYFFDTGAWLSCMSESEARRIGLAVRSSAGTIANSAGGEAGFRTAVARRLVVGGLELRDVSFAVFPDDQEPWSVLAPGERGILGIPILTAAGTIRWSRDGRLELGRRSQAVGHAAPNLFFDSDHLVVASTVGGEPVFATLDTGAETTDLYGRFAAQFASLVAARGTKDRTEVRGVGGSDSFDSVTLPELTFHLGGMDVALRPARVILKEMGARCCSGNMGLDLLGQASEFEIDLEAMRLELVPRR